MVTRPSRRLFTVDEYERMVTAGVLRPDDRVELIEGEVLEMTPQGSRHASCIDRLIRLFTSRLGERVIVRVQSSVVLSDLTQPEPDVALLADRDDFYVDAHPRPDSILLLVEVAETTRAYDLGRKAEIYARAGVPATWVVDLPERVVHVLEGPSAEGYAERRTASLGELLTVPGVHDVSFPIEDILGPR